MEFIFLLIIFLVLLEAANTQIPTNGCVNPQQYFGTSFQVTYGQNPNGVAQNQPYTGSISHSQQNPNNQPYAPYAQNLPGYGSTPYQPYFNGQTAYPLQYSQSNGYPPYPPGYGQVGSANYQPQGPFSTSGYSSGYGSTTPAPFGETSSFTPNFGPTTTGPYTFGTPGPGQQFEPGYEGRGYISNGQEYSQNQSYGEAASNPYQIGPNQTPYSPSNQFGPNTAMQPQSGGQAQFPLQNQPYGGPTSTPYLYTQPQFSQTQFPSPNQQPSGPTSTPYPPQQTQVLYPQPNQQQFQPTGQNEGRYSYIEYRQNPYLYDNQQLSTRFPYFLDPYKKK